MKQPSTIEIEYALANHFGIRQNVIVPNISWGMNIHECDLLILRTSGFCVEVEIKRSKADLIKDLEKKHGHSSPKIRELYFAIPKSMLENCISFIPERAGIFSFEKPEGKMVRITKERPPKINMQSRRLTDDERYNVARLGVMRIWSLKFSLMRK